MSLNWKEIDCVLEELELEGSFIQQIVQPNFDTIAFHTYKNGQSKTILICLAAGACRIHQTWSAVPKSNKPLRFMEFLKARIKGARINSICQLGQERIIKLELAHCGQEFLLYIRLWSNAANIILTDTNHLVLDSFYRRPKKDEVTGGIFQEPAPDVLPKSKEWEIRSFDQLPQHQELSFNQKVDKWYGEHAGQLSLEALLEQVQKFYNSRHSKMETALQRLGKKRDEFLENQQWKHYGDLILTYGHLVDGSKDFLECEDYENGGLIRIRIDPRKSAQDNATHYYNTYKKTVSGLADLEQDIKKARRELLDLEATYQQLCKEPNPIRLQQLLKRQTTPRQQMERKRPGLAYQVEGWTILVGRTASENDELLRHHVKGLDMWFHTRDYAGGYVFVKNRPGKTIPLSIMLCAGNLAVYHSKARKSGEADLYCTQVKHLRRAKNGPKGLVLPSQEKNLFIQLDKEILKGLEEAFVI